MDLFDHAMQEAMQREAPLAARMRPRSLDEFVGQEDIIGKGRLLRQAVETDKLISSIILWGPPGSGKTTLARLIASHSKSYFHTLSAVMAGKSDLREVIEAARERRRMHQQRTILFVDEVHRWNKAQQDALLPSIESGLLILIGATTQNPYFDVIPALVSRSRIFTLKPLNEEELGRILENVLNDKEKGYGLKQIAITEEARTHLIQVAGGDARSLLNALEMAVESAEPDDTGTIQIDLKTAQDSIQRRALHYDKNMDEHYDTISAFIKSIRGSDPHAALYWLAKMISAGEDPRFILRRLLILAGEDIGLADPQAITVAASAAYAYEYVGMPEGIYPIVEAALYCATAPKSNSAKGYFEAAQEIEAHGAKPVPVHLMDPSRDAKGLGHGKGYLYPHDFPAHWVAQQYLPDKLAGRQFFHPSEEGGEAEIKRRMEKHHSAK
jgi:putative ATPase